MKPSLLTNIYDEASHSSQKAAADLLFWRFNLTEQLRKGHGRSFCLVLPDSQVFLSEKLHTASYYQGQKAAPENINAAICAIRPLCIPAPLTAILRIFLKSLYAVGK